MAPSETEKATALRSYISRPIGSSWNKYQIDEAKTGKILYTCAVPAFNFMSKQRMDVTMHAGDSMDGAVVGVTKSDWSLNTTVHFALGDPGQLKVTWELLERKTNRKMNNFVFSADLPGGRRDFEWRGTHDVPVNPLFKMDCGHLKLVDVASGETVAKFVHQSPWLNRLAKGDIEIFQDFGGEEWDEVVILTCLGIRSLFQANWGFGS